MRARLSVRKRVHVFLGLFLLQGFAYFVPAATWHPVSRFALTHAIAERGELSLGNFAEATGDRAYREGRFYTDKAPFPSLLAVPAYLALRGTHALLGRSELSFEPHHRGRVVAASLRVNRSFQQLLYACSVATSGLAGALVGVLALMLLARRYSFGPALACSILVVLGTPIFPYATSFFGHVPAAAFLLGSVALLDEDPVPPRRLALAGGCLGMAVGCEYLTAVVALPIAIAAIAPLLPGWASRIGFLFAGVAVPLFVLGTYLTLCFGAPYRTGYAFIIDSVFAQGHARGVSGIAWPAPEALGGLLFGTSRGLLYLAPLAGLALVALPGALKDPRIGTPIRAYALGALALFLANAGYYMWWGGAATGPRHLVPALPLLAFGLAHAWSRWRLGPVVLGVGSISVLHMLLFAAVGIEAPEGRETLVGYAWKLALAGRFAHLQGASNLGILLGLPVAGSLGPLLAFWLLGGRALWRSRQALAEARD